ncbi:MAG: hypothetical protein ABIH23_25050 [bacterium]
MGTSNKSEQQESVERFSVSLQDICLSNSWALQAILDYLEEEQPGARDRIWQKYLELKRLSEEADRKG